MSTGDWALAVWNRDRFAGMLFWGAIAIVNLEFLC
jgi:hypothetical protein